MPCMSIYNPPDPEPSDQIIQQWRSINEGSTPITPELLLDRGWVKDDDSNTHRHGNYQIFKGRSAAYPIIYEDEHSWKFANLNWCINLDFTTIERLDAFFVSLQP